MAFVQLVVLSKPNILQYLFNESLSYRKTAGLIKQLRVFNYTAF